MCRLHFKELEGRKLGLLIKATQCSFSSYLSVLEINHGTYLRFHEDTSVALALFLSEISTIFCKFTRLATTAVCRLPFWTENNNDSEYILNCCLNCWLMPNLFIPFLLVACALSVNCCFVPKLSACCISTFQRIHPSCAVSL